VTIGGKSVNYYLSGVGHDKASSSAPCMVWLMKPLADEKKCMFTTGARDETMTFADAHAA
jgi:hypothetical protein